MKNPCFWEKHHYTKEADPYALSPYAPPIGATMKYDPWGHVMYYKRARERFSYHTNYWLKKIIKNEYCRNYQIVKKVKKLVVYYFFKNKLKNQFQKLFKKFIKLSVIQIYVLT